MSFLAPDDPFYEAVYGEAIDRYADPDVCEACGKPLAGDPDFCPDCLADMAAKRDR